MEVEKNTGYNNPYQHLLSCYFRSDKKAMHDSYWEALASKKAQASLCNFFSKATSDKDGGDDGGEQNKGDKGGGLPPRLLTEKDKELFEWIESIVEDNLPVVAVHSKKWRRRLKHEHCFHKKTVTGVKYDNADIPCFHSYQRRNGHGSVWFNHARCLDKV